MHCQLLPHLPLWGYYLQLFGFKNILLGHLVCGECQCFDRPDFGDKYFGDQCQCYGNHTNPLDPDSSCRPAEGKQLCSGRGSCECGRCVCDELPDMRIYGEFCQCDNVSCERDNAGMIYLEGCLHSKSMSK